MQNNTTKIGHHTGVEEQMFKQGTEIWSSTSIQAKKEEKSESEQRGDKLGT